MSVPGYLHKLLVASGEYSVTDGDKSHIRDLGLDAYILSKLLSKKFRKWKVDPACLDRTKKAVELRMNAGEPITVVYFQGGYKLWRLPSSPESDWAEFFNISYILQYVAPIAAAYAPGVDLVYYVHTLLMEKHDNLTLEEISAYGVSFQMLIDAFSKYLPETIRVRIVRDADLYDRKSYFTELEKCRIIAQKHAALWTEERKMHLAKMAQLNIKWDGKEDWTHLSESGKSEKIRLACVYEDAASLLDRPVKAVKIPQNVLIFTKPTPAMIGIGSTFTSVAKHWAGFGVLESDAERYYPRILSPSQYENAMKVPHRTVHVSLGLTTKNFSEIMLYPGRMRI